jgi:hypothetical protein
MGGIDLDPASCEVANETVGAKEFFTEETNGLDKPWHGRVFLNPPYCLELISKFTDKLVEEVEAGNVTQAIMLTNNSTDTQWFHCVLEVTSAICLVKGRIKYWSNRGTPTKHPLQGQVFFYVGPERARFKEAFSQFGKVFFDGDGTARP